MACRRSGVRIPLAPPCDVSRHRNDPEPLMGSGLFWLGSGFAAEWLVVRSGGAGPIGARRSASSRPSASMKVTASLAIASTLGHHPRRRLPGQRERSSPRRRQRRVSVWPLVVGVSLASGGVSVGHNRTRPPPCMRWRGPCSTYRSRLAGLPGSTGSGGPTAGAGHPLPVPVSRLLRRSQSFP